jgi:hypothetical protein
MDAVRAAELSTARLRRIDRRGSDPSAASGRYSASCCFTDCATKHAAETHLLPGTVPHEFPGELVRLTLAYNPGAAMASSASTCGLPLLAPSASSSWGSSAGPRPWDGWLPLAWRSSLAARWEISSTAALARGWWISSMGSATCGSGPSTSPT